MKRYAQKRFYEWSPAIAYSVGLMASDGCLSKDRRHVDLTSVDIEQLENFAKAIGRAPSISKKTGRVDGQAQQAYRIQFSDTAYYDFLVQLGLTPNKSRGIGPLDIPDEYYSHFLRGIFDGDGSTYGYYDKRWRSSFMFYVQFTSASKIFLEYLLQFNRRLLNVQGGSIHGLGSSGAFNLSFGKVDSVILYNAMYKDSDGLLLIRKRRKLEGFISLHGNGIITSNARVL